jgi:predicted phosphodiesterase
MGANSAGQRAVASQIYKCKPDFIVCAGDIVYTMGLFSEYLEKFFPIYNTAEIGSAQPPNGVPLLRSTISFGVIGNHDVAFGDNREGVNLDKFKDDGLAFFKIWSSPLNGPTGDLHAQNVPKLLGSEAQISRYTDSVGAKYPRMSNYSFNYGNAHWLVLDANPYMDWRDPLLRKWVKKDLADAKDATWKFVCFHQPGFSYDAAHYQEQRMRLLCDLFDTGNVDVVFSGHAHDYQRSFPLKFTATRKNGQPTINTDGTVDGAILLDKDYDGEKNQHPSGIIYLVSGAGGAPLYGPISIKNPNIPRTFTKIFDSDHHSFTDCVVSGNSLAIKQIAGDGTIVDSFNIQKAPSRKDNPVSSNRKKVRNTP